MAEEDLENAGDYIAYELKLQAYLLSDWQHFFIIQRINLLHEHNKTLLIFRIEN